MEISSVPNVFQNVLVINSETTQQKDALTSAPMDFSLTIPHGTVYKTVLNLFLQSQSTKPVFGNAQEEPTQTMTLDHANLFATMILFFSAITQLGSVSRPVQLYLAYLPIPTHINANFNVQTLSLLIT